MQKNDSVLTKCHFIEDYDPKSEIEISAFARVWNENNFEQPIFVKYKSGSDATRNTKLYIPGPFCRRYLPVIDTVMTLETENGELYKVKYLPRAAAFSGGWGRFVVCEKLVQGDLAVFHLVSATRFKVYIIKKGSSTVILPTHLLKLYKKTSERVVDDNQFIVDKRRHSNDNCRNAEKVVKTNFDNITGFEDSQTVINNLLQHHDLSEVPPQAYYKVCHSQNEFLHRYLQKDLNPNLLVATKCQFTEDYDPKCEIEISVLARVWNKSNFEQPIFVKYVSAPKAARKSKLSIPPPFCRRYLPGVDTVMTLETENGELYEVKYLPRGTTFSAGWGRFAFCKKLARGDIAVFHLVRSTRFKVYIIRKGSLTVELPTHLVNLYKKAGERVLGYSSTSMERKDNVATKCHFREDYNPKSELEMSVLARVWNNMNFEQPIFVKYVFVSDTTRNSKLRIPTPFCRRYLPVVDTLMTLEMENGELYEAKYLFQGAVFSAGWGRFAVCEKLARGDVVVFHLVGATRFKVYIIRKGSSTVKLPTHLLKLYKKASERVLDDNQFRVYKRRHANDNCRNAEEVVETKFNNITGFEHFKTVINNSLQHHDLSEVLLHAYYKLCRSQNAFLHEVLVKDLNPNLFVGAISSIISTTVNISTGLRTCTLSTFLDNVSDWSKTLEIYNSLGMNVSFLSSRLHDLHNLAFSSEGAVSRRKYIEACHERPRCEHELQKLKMILDKWRKISVLLVSKVKDLDSMVGWEAYTEAYFRLIQAKDEIKEIEVLMVELSKFLEHYDDVIESLKLKANKHEHEFLAKVRCIMDS